MSAVLTEQLGPRGRRRVRIATWVSGALIVALIAWAFLRFLTRGEFAPELYEQFIDFETEWPQFLIAGLGYTIRAALVAMVFATAIGFVMALGRLANSTVVRWLARIYVEAFRAVPLLLFIIFAFLGLQRAFDVNWITPFWGLIIGLTAYNSAVLAEIFRAGILSLDRGQFEAASVIGLTYWQSMRIVILPQAIRRMTPAIVAQLATLTKDTSLGFVVGYQEIMRRAQVLGQGSPNNLLQAYVVVGIIYFIVIFGLSRVARRLEVQQRRKYGAGKMAGGAGMEDVEALGEDADEDEAAEHRTKSAVSA